jgi:hypothetical protein
MQTVATPRLAANAARLELGRSLLDLSLLISFFSGFVGFVLLDGCNSGEFAVAPRDEYTGNHDESWRNASCALSTPLWVLLLTHG